MKIFLVRHGEAVLEKIDPQRPLSDTGMEQIYDVAKFLMPSGFIPDVIYHSTEKRSEQTARILQQKLNPKSKFLLKENLLPDDPVDKIYNELIKNPSNIIIVGHLPFLNKLLSKLITGKEEYNIVHFTPGATAVLESVENIGWKLTGFIQPDFLNYD